MRKIFAIMTLFGLALAAPAGAADGPLTLGDYRQMKAAAAPDLARVLGTVYEAAVYAQSAIPGVEICVTPVPRPAAELEAMLDAEIRRDDNGLGRAYADRDHLALAMVNALRHEDVCR